MGTFNHILLLLDNAAKGYPHGQRDRAMSNLYVTEPATTGRVIVDTSLGEIEIELWCKETPKACRNFLGLVMEGYYDNTIFHRVVPGFICQTGDPRGTGMGGESFYGEPFANEPHQRLKFNRRGLIGMANSGNHTNTSQWFITLDRAEELQNKHTLFGKITGPTVFNVLKIGQLELDAQEKPLYPPKINSIQILENPFDDIVPRITREERLMQQQAKIAAREDAEKRETRRKAKKNTGLLSFGEQADAESSTTEPVKRGSMARPDFVEDDVPSGPAQTYFAVPASLANLGKNAPNAPKPSVPRKTSQMDSTEGQAISAADPGPTSDARKAEIQRMQDKIRLLNKRRAGSGSDDSDDEVDNAEGSRKKRTGPSFLEQELAKYSSGRRGKKKAGKRDEDDVMAMLSSFRGKIQKAGPSDMTGQAAPEADAEDGNPNPDKPVEEEEGMEVDDDLDFIRHALVVPKESDAERTRRAEDEYLVIDPREKAKQLKDERKTTSSRRGRGGGGMRY